MKISDINMYSLKRSKAFAIGQSFTILIFGSLLFACSDFVEVDPPKNTLIAETIFEDPATVESTLANLYFDIRERGMVSGTYGIMPALAIYSDEMDYYGLNADLSQFNQHSLSAANNRIQEWWQQAYHLIYGANDIISGVEASKSLTEIEKANFRGQALIIRAYLYSLLVPLFGDVPYVDTTDYLVNNTISRSSRDEIYDHIITDLEHAIALLDGMDIAGTERIIPDAHVAQALLARTYVYREEWELARSMATELIEAFQLEPDLDQVFLKESRETIWQLQADPDNFPTNTREAGELIIEAIPGQSYALSESLLAAFEDDDLRYGHWVDSMSNSDNTVTLYYAHKYKAGLDETQSLEYSIVLRLAEQYLIRAEARARSGELAGARADLNMIRSRAGRPNTSATTEPALLEEILEERRLELFTEQGHRWFDLKRTENAGTVLSDIKPGWRETDLLLPIPETELSANPNLLPQNPGY